MAGQGTLTTNLNDQGDTPGHDVVAAPEIPLLFPGNYKDQGIQINFTNEKLVIRFGMNAMDSWFRMARFDVFGKVRWPTRPNG
jgi:hypothetical protein